MRQKYIKSNVRESVVEAIARTLQRGPLSVSQIAGRTGWSPGTVSQALRKNPDRFVCVSEDATPYRSRKWQLV